MQWRVNVILSMMSASPEIYSGGASIHAPVKSATYVGKPAFRKPDGFNPRAREERDRCILSDSIIRKIMNASAKYKKFKKIDHKPIYKNICY